MLGNTRNLAVTGTSRFLCSVLTGGVDEWDTEKKERRPIRTEAENEIPVILKKSAISTSSRNVLRAPQIDVDSIAVLLDDFGGAEEILGIIGAKLHYQWSIGRRFALFTRGNIEELIPILLGVVRKKLRGKYQKKYSNTAQGHHEGRKRFPVFKEENEITLALIIGV